jgi:hypothetical protein
MRRFHAPCDPECPEFGSYLRALVEDPMGRAMGAPLDEFIEAYEKRHRTKCKHCMEYGAKNIEVEYY